MRSNITLFVGFCLCCFLSTPREAQAQDPRFSQFYAAPTELNPAMIGVYEGKFRVVANYRELYSSILASHPFRTIAASFDMRQRVQQQDYFGFGFSVLRDDVGISQFHRTKANLGASFMKQLGGSRYSMYDQYLVAGAQLGFGQHGLNWQKLWFSEQFNTDEGFIDTSTPSGENFDKQTTGLYLDFNAGLLWYILFDDHLSLYAGGALHHLNSPNVSFLEGSEDNLSTRWTAHAGGEIPFTRELSLLPAVAVMGQNTYFSTTAGGAIQAGLDALETVQDTVEAGVLDAAGVEAEGLARRLAHDGAQPAPGRIRTLSVPGRAACSTAARPSASE